METRYTNEKEALMFIPVIDLVVECPEDHGCCHEIPVTIPTPSEEMEHKVTCPACGVHITYMAVPGIGYTTTEVCYTDKV